MIPECFDWGRDGPNPGWHRRWMLFLLTVGPLALAAVSYFYYGPEKGMAGTSVFLTVAFAKGVEYAVMRVKEGQK